MKPAYIVWLFTILMVSTVVGYSQQTKNTGELLENSPADTNRVKQLLKLANFYYFSKPDSCLAFAKEAAELSRKLNFTSGEFEALTTAGEAFRFLGEFPQALDMQFKALQLSRDMGDKNGEAASLGFIGLIYLELNEYREGLNYLHQANKIFESLSNPVMNAFNLSNIGNAYERMNMLDSALFFQQHARAKSEELNHGNLKILILTRLGIALARLGKHEQALQYYRDALQNASLIGDKVNPSRIHNWIAKSYLAINREDSSMYHARLSFVKGQQSSQKLHILEASDLLVNLFRKKNMPDSIIYYQAVSAALKDSLYGPEKFKQLQLLMLSQQQQQQAIQQEQQQYKNKTRLLALVGLLAMFLLIAILLLRNVRQKQKANTLLNHQKNEIEDTLSKLKSTQSQLIQSEKMASLGELTAGIAHEIQNPLNFVNNFSEVNKELVDELQQELKAGKIDEAVAISNDIKENEEKINHHGKRADAIVKGMLQHSRTGSGQKEPTDINALADEYLRLAYHGLRAKDKSFNATFKTDFDQSIGKINVISQEIGRVILNLITNAFYAVNEKNNHLAAHQYEPNVNVSTKKTNGKVEVKVRDNGNGIPQKIMDKIFQPFFTTKPTGQGTGLGLSLSYDIITKGHGGELKVETKEGEGSTFIIILPEK
ncbi:MAG: ATP-binding protein [Chitinophagales bacterium]